MRHDLTATLNSGAMNNAYNSMQNANAPPPETRPLTSEVMTQTELAIDAASRAHGNLYELRNRLFNCSPETGNTGLAKSSPSSFSEAYQERAEVLSNMLTAIERLASELAQRL